MNDCVKRGEATCLRHAILCIISSMKHHATVPEEHLASELDEDTPLPSGETKSELRRRVQEGWQTPHLVRLAG